MAESAYNNAKNASSGYMLFKFNCSYHPWMLYKKDVNPCTKSKSANKLSAKLKKLIIIYKKNLYHAQELQKQVHNKCVKPRSYTLNDKIWLNSKYIKIKQNWKLKAKFFRPFQVLYPVEKQAYKLELSRKSRIHNIFHMSQLKQDITKKKRVDEDVTKLNTNKKSGKYKVKVSYNSVVYTKESELGYLLRLYYLVF